MSKVRSPYKSKTLATWVALLGGTLGLHRFYLHGFKDVWGWLHPLPTMLGLYGVERMQQLGQDDPLAWLLIPVLGLMLAGTMLQALLYGLMPDDKWNARHNPQGPQHDSGWAVVLALVVALLVGAGVLMATIAFGGQKYFEYQLEQSSSLERPTHEAGAGWVDSPAPIQRKMKYTAPTRQSPAQMKSVLKGWFM